MINKLKGFERLQYNVEKERLKKATAVNESKKELLNDALSYMIERCMDELPDETDQEIIHGLVENLIHENGGYITTMRKFRTKSYALSEAIRLTEKYSKIVEQAIGDNKNTDVFKIDVDTKNKFYKELEGLDMEQADEIISKRVRNNTYDFIKNNTIANDKILDIIDATKTKIDELNDKRSPESIKNNVLGEAASMKEQIIAKSGINTNPFGIVVKNLAKGAYVDDRIKEIISTSDGKIDINTVDKYGHTFYTFLEAANGLKMAEINKDNIVRFMKLK